MKNTLSFKQYTRTIIFLFIITSAQMIFSQENGIYEIANSNTTQKTSSINHDRKEFNKLVYNLHSTIYYENSIEKKVYGNTPPIKLTFEDANSLSLLMSGNNKFKNVQLITINLNSIDELKKPIDISLLEDLSNLKYVYIKCPFKFDLNLLKSFIRVKTGVRIFYNNQIPS